MVAVCIHHKAWVAGINNIGFLEIKCLIYYSPERNRLTQSSLASANSTTKWNLTIPSPRTLPKQQQRLCPASILVPHRWLEVAVNECRRLARKGDQK